MSRGMHLLSFLMFPPMWRDLYRSKICDFSPPITVLSREEKQLLWWISWEKEPGLHIPGLHFSLFHCAVGFAGSASVKEDCRCPEQPGLGEWTSLALAFSVSKTLGHSLKWYLQFHRHYSCIHLSVGLGLKQWRKGGAVCLSLQKPTIKSQDLGHQGNRSSCPLWLTIQALFTYSTDFN